MTMLSLHKKVQIALLAARKSRETEKVSLLSTLVGEIETQAKSGKSTSDADITAVIKKFVKNIDEVLKHVQIGTEQHTIATNEKKLLESFLPVQLTEDQLRSIITRHINAGAATVGDVMKVLKTEYAGLYDGAIASKLIRELM